MPRAGGGSRGGGGFGGGRGGFGGGRGGFGGGPRGGFGGGPRGPHHHHHHHRGFYGGFWGPRYYGYGGGCLGGLMGLMLLPVIFFLMGAMLLFSAVGSIANVVSGGQVIYNEETFNEYAVEQYVANYGSSEDCILVTFLVQEDRRSYDCMVMYGNHFNEDMQSLLNLSNSGFEKGFYEMNYQSTYENGFDSILVVGIDYMNETITEKNLESYYTRYCKDTNHNPTSSKLINNTELVMDISYVNEALDYFTESTGISLIILVEDAEDALGKTILMKDIVFTIIALVFIVIAIVLITKAVKARKKNNEDDGSYRGGNNGNNNYNYNNNNNYNNDNYYNGF